MSDGFELSNLVSHFEKARVLCIGDIMLDLFIHGEVNRISPEGPIPVLRIHHEMLSLGGAGNVIRNLTSLGTQSSFIGVVGDDTYGHKTEDLLKQEKNLKFALSTAPHWHTTLKTRYLANHQQLLRVDQEAFQERLPEAIEAEILKNAKTFLKDATVLVISDYGKGVLREPLLRDLIGQANTLNIPTIIDPKGADYERYRGASLITPNRQELAQAARMPTQTTEEVIKAAQKLIQECGIKAVLATRSQEGMTLVTAEGLHHHIPTRAQEVFDVSGAGDTVVATLAAAVGSGVDLISAIRLSNAAAGIVVGKVGTATVQDSELSAVLRHSDFEMTERKILGLEEAEEVVLKWRRQGKKVGFTNGCFDLLHPGHISLLKQARKQCDRLIVGLNSDDSVKRLKGETRPIQSEMARATVLAALECVDSVVLFEEDTPLTLIKTLKPDILVKGADYTIDKVVGADIVQKYGGRVYLAQLEPGQSTTSTVAKINKTA